MDNAHAKGKALFWGDYVQYTPTGVSLARKAGRYITDGSKVRRGDLAFFYYDSLGRVGHVLAAYVVSVNYSREIIHIKSIEGNTDVYKRQIPQRRPIFTNSNARFRPIPLSTGLFTRLPSM